MYSVRFNLSLHNPDNYVYKSQLVFSGLKSDQECDEKVKKVTDYLESHGAFNSLLFRIFVPANTRELSEAAISLFCPVTASWLNSSYYTVLKVCLIVFTVIGDLVSFPFRLLFFVPRAIQQKAQDWMVGTLKWSYDNKGINWTAFDPESADGLFAMLERGILIVDSQKAGKFGKDIVSHEYPRKTVFLGF